MPPKAAKRKSTATKASPDTNGVKKAKRSSDHDDALRKPHPWADTAAEQGIVQLKYYPPEMSTDRARSYAEEGLMRPMEELVQAQRKLFDKQKKTSPGDAVVHWFKCDLRTNDNTSLALASAKAQELGVPLICMYIVSPQDFEAHLTSPVRVDFILRTLQVLKDDLAKLDIPLYMETVAKRKEVPKRICQLLDDWGANHLFANMEYEVDELRRERKLIESLVDAGKSFEVVHDTCVVAPGQLRSGSGNQYAVYTPWYKSWMAHIHSNLDLLDLHEPPAKNASDARSKFKALFESKIPTAPESKSISKDEATRFHALWPCGEHEAKKRLDLFCEERIGGYADSRNLPATNGTSCISVHLASGTLSARTCVRTARDRNKSKKLDGGTQGIVTWISEVAWRDFYKHVMVRWPHVW